MTELQRNLLIAALMLFVILGVVLISQIRIRQQFVIAGPRYDIELIKSLSGDADFASFEARVATDPEVLHAPLYVYESPLALCLHGGRIDEAIKLIEMGADPLSEMSRVGPHFRSASEDTEMITALEFMTRRCYVPVVESALAVLGDRVHDDDMIDTLILASERSCSRLSQRLKSIQAAGRTSAEDG